jgi:CMP/dCMP kinase
MAAREQASADMAGFMTIALDGPSGAGKSTIARLLAKKLGILYLDTGAMYRAVGLKALRSGVSVRSEADMSGMLAQTELKIIFSQGEQKIILDGEDVKQSIRTPEVSRAASDVSALKAVRLRLVELQREIAARQPLVLDGRDIGTFVLPHAPYKFFLTASPHERARRRLAELKQKGDLSTYEQVLNDIEYRDRQDSQRSLAPLCQADDAVLIDTTDMTPDEVIRTVLARMHLEVQEGV